ncbi:hypothetical protein Gogos_019687 [Gossypium gossypioides]|uniref:BZIP domain-containing protein n=1 Tax=Gossypium gossypioides TaxID=34282 RepID=A0A7J9BID0_GOSGO|nr:hypothetical protein [Gossypium gossypioides]
MEEINWDTLLLEANLPDFKDILDNEPEQVTKPLPQPYLTQNPDEEMVVSLWIGEIEKVLIEDDNFDYMVETQIIPDDDFLADLLLRNRDAVVRSRKRKKMYVKDLEMKSRYFEGECRRLSHMLQCFIAENQAL